MMNCSVVLAEIWFVLRRLLVRLCAGFGCPMRRAVAVSRQTASSSTGRP